MDFLTSNFRLHSTDTILLVWGEGFLHPDFFFFFLFVSRKDRTDDL